MWKDWMLAGAICIAFGAFEAVASGKDPAGALRSIRHPAWSPPIWLWAIIGAGWYLICFTSLVRLIPLAGEQRVPLVLLLLLMLANGAAGIVQLRMKRFDLALWIMLPYAGLVLAFLWTVRPLDRVSFLLFLGYAIYLIYAAAWGWSLWRLNRRGSAER